MIRYLVCGLLSLLTAYASADAISPAYLEINEIIEDQFQVLWKVPAKGDRVLKVRAQFPESCQTKHISKFQAVPGAALQNMQVQCEGGLIDKKIKIIGLDRLQNEVLVKIKLLTGQEQMTRLYGIKSTLTVERDASSLDIMLSYLEFGVEHILAGIDHLLFVLALVLIVSDKRRLIWTVTAFTLAHSITLIGVTLGWLWLPSKPVEAVIALSIVLLALEILHAQQGKLGATARWPWMVAFAFGLLHGFGFAGALQEVGLPSSDLFNALLFFNLGVELGQLIFVLLVLIAGKVFMQFFKHRSQQGITLLAYGIGSVATFWAIDRSLSIFI